MRTQQALRKEATTGRAVFYALAVLVIGLLVLWGASSVAPAVRASRPALLSRERMSDVLGQAGALLVGTAVLAVLWDLVTRRAFLEELLGRFGAVASLENGRVTGLTFRVHEEIQWRELIAQASSIDILMAYGTWWRELYGAELQAVLARKGTRIRVFLPDAENEPLVLQLAARFDTSAEEVRSRINDARSYFVGLRPIGEEARVQVAMIGVPLLFSGYLLGSTGIVALYSHRPVDASVPAFLCREGGTLFEYLRSEMAALSDGSVPARFV